MTDDPLPASMDARTREVVADLETAFGVGLSDDEAARCATVEGATEVLVERLEAADGDEEELVEKALRRVRVAFPANGGETADMGMPLDLLLPRLRRRFAWWRARRMLGVRLPWLVEPRVLVTLAVVLVVLSEYLGARAWVARIPPLTPVAELLVASSVLSVLAVVFLRPRPPARCSRVEGVVRRLLVERLESLSGGRPWTRGRVREVVRFLHAEPRPPAPGTIAPVRPVVLAAGLVLGLLAGHATWRAGDALTRGRFEHLLERGVIILWTPPIEAVALLARYRPLAADVARLLRSGSPPQRRAALTLLPFVASEVGIDADEELVSALVQRDDGETSSVAAAVLARLIHDGHRLSDDHLDAVVEHLVVSIPGDHSLAASMLLDAVGRMQPVPVEDLRRLASTGDMFALAAVVTPLCDAGATALLLDDALDAYLDAPDEDEREAAEDRLFDLYVCIAHEAGLEESERLSLWKAVSEGDPERLRAWRDELVERVEARRANR